uniref:CBS domain-containing protein n=1 Tax=Arcella intermedia TaxID=1963864 RepID=A0A6B2L9P8_9EUKA
MVQFLQESLIKDLLHKSADAPQQILYVTPNTTLRNAIEVLAKNKILAVPVRAEEDVNYIGWFSIINAVSFILNVYSESSDVEDPGVWTTWCKDIDTLTHRGVQLGDKTVEEAMDKTWIAPVSAVGSVFELIDSVFTTKKHIHRVCVCNDENDNYVRAIVTQSDVIQFLYKNALEKKILGHLGNLRVGEMPKLRKHFETESPISMSVNALAIHAFWLINFHHVHGVAIVEPSGKLIANLSASDIKGLSSGSLPFSSLLLPLKEFMVKSKLSTPITATLDNTFFEIVQKLAVNRIHRLWLVDYHGKPTGVITLTAIMQFIKDLDN